MKNRIDSALVRVPGIAAALLITAGLAGFAGAATPDNIPAIVVHYGDLNLQTDAGLQTLYRRLRHAATQVCPETSSDRDLARYAAARSCQAAALARATRALQDPHLVEVMIERFKLG